ncbi:MAG: hypothetical protein FWC00_01300 [Firmicutes bacterium]|nr:hypothetical protein [Bacillota bacterium]
MDSVKKLATRIHWAQSTGMPDVHNAIRRVFGAKVSKLDESAKLQLKNELASALGGTNMWPVIEDCASSDKHGNHESCAVCVRQDDENTCEGEQPNPILAFTAEDVCKAFGLQAGEQDLIDVLSEMLAKNFKWGGENLRMANDVLYGGRNFSLEREVWLRNAKRKLEQIMV